MRNAELAGRMRVDGLYSLQRLTVDSYYAVPLGAPVSLAEPMQPIPSHIISACIRMLCFLSEQQAVPLM